MRRKSDFATTLSDMFCDDEKKRITAIKMIKEIASVMGPARVRNEFVPFLNEFLDDDPPVMSAVLTELQNFSPYLGGSEFDQILLPLLISFCGLDEKEVAMKAVQLIEAILEKHSDASLDVIRKIAKMNMAVSKESAILLIASTVTKIPHLEQTLLEIYRSILFSQNPAYRVIGAKHFTKLVVKVSNKEQILKMVESIFQDSQDLPKLLIIDALLELYSVNSNTVLSKFKTLICIGSWRMNIRLCGFSEQFSHSLSKNHFKLLFEPFFLKLLASDDNETRAAACPAIVCIARNMSPQQCYNMLCPVLRKLSEDQCDMVKNSFAIQIVKVFPYFSKEKINQSLLPLVIKMLKESSLEVVSGILCEFKELSSHLNKKKFEELVIKPLTNQLNSDNWRLQIQTLDILGKIVIEQMIYTPFVVDLLLAEMKNKIEAVRKKGTEIIIEIIQKADQGWCDTELIPKLLKSKDEMFYQNRHKLLTVIDQTADHVSAATLGEYRKVIGMLLFDKIPNIRLLALKTGYCRKRLLDKMLQSSMMRLKDDSDIEIKHMIKSIKI